MNRTTVTAVLALLTLAPLAHAAVSVKVVRVEESRVKELLEDADPSQGTMLSQVTLTLRLEGPEIAGATEYGQPRITQASDDTGASLKPEPLGAGDFFMPLQSGAFASSDEQAAARPTEVRVSLNAPQRNAAKITRVRGEVRVKAGGEKKVVMVAGVNGRIGKRVDDPALKAAKLTVTVLDPKAQEDGERFGADAGPGGGAVSVKITGDNSVVKQVDVVGPDGQSISQGRSTAGSGNTTVYSVMFDRELDQSMSLKIELLTGQKVVRVPIDLRDVPLP